MAIKLYPFWGGVAADGLSAVATSGAYSDLTGRPTLGTAAAANKTEFISSTAPTFAAPIIETPVVANTGAAYTINTANGTVFDLTLTANCTFTLPAASGGAQFTLWITQGTGGPFTATFPANVRASYGIIPAPSASVGKTDIFSFLSLRGYWVITPGSANLTLS